jgi:hypothetical protein
VTSIRQRLAWVFVFGLAATASACGGDGVVLPGESSPATLTIVSGDGQSASAGLALGNPLVVRVRRFDRPVEGQSVEFTTTWRRPGNCHRRD